ncbi:MAG: hypothetical protein M1816_004345 [Peltula sp. TS41687]|nr:MAG: hypothetical protein M1816_004345 [Peltula sp. TS41687]
MVSLGLVNYSDSEASETGVAPAPTTKLKALSKPTVERVVDRLNPHKIRVHLPKSTEDTTKDEVGDGDEPPSKKPRIAGGGGGGGGGGAFSGFNSLLPAPKRTSQTSGGSGTTGNASRTGALGGGRVQLKTSATPGFSREVERPAAELEETFIHEGDGDETAIDGEAKRMAEQREVPSDMAIPTAKDMAGPGLKKDVKPMMFKPLSVARKSQQKKKSGNAPRPPVTSTNRDEAHPKQKPKAPPKVSLFSIDSSESTTLASPSGGEYKPMVYGTHKDETSTPLDATFEPSLSQEHEISQYDTYQASVSSHTGPQSLDSIAADLGLSESAKRQLFGRQKGSGQEQTFSAVNVINFNTDQEYAANEALRAAGESVQHNPVRAIAPGKHSLKQLVSAAHNQKDALEDHFASGRRNKKEAGSKYGW